MADLTDILDRHVRSGSLPGAVGLVARAGRTEVAAVGAASVDGVAILLAQVAADSPVPPEWMRDFWRYAASVA